MGAPASVTFDAKGHLLLLTRGAQPFFEFDENGTFIRAFGDGLFTRAHGVRLDGDGNIWATDVGAHVVYKLNPQGQVLLALGRKGEAGEWNEAAGSRKLNQPNDVAMSVATGVPAAMVRSSAHAIASGARTGSTTRRAR